MPYRAPTRDDLQHFQWLRGQFRLGAAFMGYVEQMAPGVQRHSGRRLRRDALTGLTTTLNVILWNLYRSHQLDPNRYVGISRTTAVYTRGEFNPLRLNGEFVRRVLDYLSASDPTYVETRGGNINRETGRGVATRVRASRRLIEELEEFILNHEERGPEGRNQEQGQQGQGTNRNITYRITRNTLDGDPNSIIMRQLFTRADLPIIQLRDENKRPIPFDPTNETRRMEASLRAFNTFLSQDHWIDLLLTDAAFRALNETPFGEHDIVDRGRRSRDIDLLTRNTLTRIFNNEDFEQGGRFYGGWWQEVPQRDHDFRSFITINGYPTAEVDFSNMQIAMLYALGGQRLDGDAYEIDGVPPTEQNRNLIKVAMLKLVNAEGRMRPLPLDTFPEGWTWERLIDALEEKHRPIANHFRTGVGLRLQRVDSDIAETVMNRMMQLGRLVLPVHDSFIVQDGYQDQLERVMREAYAERMGQEPRVRHDATLYEQITRTLPRDMAMVQQLGFTTFEEFRQALNDDGIEVLDEPFQELLNQPEYQGYRGRIDDFLAVKGERWFMEHNFYR